MGWFQTLCRNVGLMIHNIKSPDDKKSEKRELKRSVEEKEQGNVTLRRTTIDEIEFKRDDK